MQAAASSGSGGSTREPSGSDAALVFVSSEPQLVFLVVFDGIFGTQPLGNCMSSITIVLFT
jgi:hypothetical protein